MTTIYVHGETRTFTSDRQEEFKPMILNAIEALNAIVQPTAQMDVLSYIGDNHSDAFSDADMVLYDSHGALYHWQRIATYAASELRADGYLEPITTKGAPWRLTGKGGYKISPSSTEQQADINTRNVAEIRASTCPKHNIVLPATGRCDDC